jgi:hypothetical protein
MKAFLIKYKLSILFWLTFLSIVLYFAPRQTDYYVDDDIRDFKTSLLTPILIWTGGVVSVLVLFLVLAKTKSIKRSMLSFLYMTVALAFFLFIFQHLFLAASLFINRQFKQESLQKNYLVSYMAGAEHTRDNFHVYDISAKQIATDNKLINRLYHPELKQDDTLTLKFEKGLLGIAFQAQPFTDK